MVMDVLRVEYSYLAHSVSAIEFGFMIFTCYGFFWILFLSLFLFPFLYVSATSYCCILILSMA